MTTREMTENDAPPYYSLTEAGAWADGYNAAVAEIGAELAKLKDPAAVHLNMLRGEIAKPSWESIKHVYAAEAEAERAHVERLTAALKPFADVADDFDADGREMADEVGIYANTAGDFRRAREALSGYITPHDSQRYSECDCKNGGNECTWIKMHAEPGTKIHEDSK